MAVAGPIEGFIQFVLGSAAKRMEERLGRNPTKEEFLDESRVIWDAAEALTFPPDRASDPLTVMLHMVDMLRAVSVPQEALGLALAGITTSDRLNVLIQEQSDDPTALVVVLKHGIGQAVAMLRDTRLRYEPGGRFIVFPDSPDAGDPECLCSRCGQVIASELAPIVRFVVGESSDPNAGEMRFHAGCLPEGMGPGDGNGTEDDARRIQRTTE